MMTRAVVLTRQILTYHHARMNAAACVFEKLDVLSVANEAKFSELLSQDIEQNFTVHRLYADLASYLEAAAKGEVSAKVRKTLDLIQPDVVAVAGWASAESYAALLWATKNNRAIVLMSDSQAHDTRRNPVRDWVKSRIVRLAGAGFVAGRTHRDYLVQLGMSRDDVTLGYDVVDNAHFAGGAEKARKNPEDSRNRLDLPENYLFASARFIPKKNLEGLLKAYHLSLSKVSTCPDLLIAGDGDSRASILKLVDDLGLRKRVHLPGFIGYDDLPALYGLASGFIHIPHTEQWGLVVNEAAAAGLPLIVSKECGAAQELLEPQKNGWRVPANDTDQIADALAALFSLDATEQQKMGKESARIVSHWGPERFAKGLEEAANIALARQPVRPTLIDRLIFFYMSKKVIEKVA